MAGPRARIRLDFAPDCAVGPGKIALLEGIVRTGSLSAAARSLGMSYRRGWLLVHSLNEGFRQPLVALNAGGRDGGGASLTPLGAAMLARYRRFERKVDRLADKDFAAFAKASRAATVPAKGRPAVRSIRSRMPRSR
ncbi:MAG: LysR family transcriptional regulator [Gammaproteobacteria bacterium]|nr:LysR family transcriptional regulator [Gammaproteobacteria bacterium]